MWKDAIVEEIRKTRKEISRKFDFAPKRFVAFYKEKQKKRMADKLLKLK